MYKLLFSALGELCVEKNIFPTLKSIESLVTQSFKHDSPAAVTPVNYNHKRTVRCRKSPRNSPSPAPLTISGASKTTMVPGGVSSMP